MRTIGVGEIPWERCVGFIAKSDGPIVHLREQDGTLGQYRAIGPLFPTSLPPPKPPFRPYLTPEQQQALQPSPTTPIALQKNKFRFETGAQKILGRHFVIDESVPTAVIEPLPLMNVYEVNAYVQQLLQGYGCKVLVPYQTVPYGPPPQSINTTCTVQSPAEQQLKSILVYFVRIYMLHGNPGDAVPDEWRCVIWSAGTWQYCETLLPVDYSGRVS